MRPKIENVMHCIGHLMNLYHHKNNCYPHHHLSHKLIREVLS